MKKLDLRSLAVGALLCCALVPGAAASAPASGERTVTRNYTGWGGVTVSDYPGVFVQDASPEGQDTGESVGGAAFFPESQERWFRVVASDASGQPVAVRVFWIKPGADEFGPPKTFCSGETPVLKVHPRGFVQSFLVAGPCGSSVSAPTRGEISITFSPERI